MRQVIVRYKVKPGRAEENEQFIKRVFEALERERPSGLRYSSYKLSDGVSFVHVASQEMADGTNVLTALPEFKEFTADIKSRCDEPPVSTEWTEVGSFDTLHAVPS
jgi:hypothetical protein